MINLNLKDQKVKYGIFLIVITILLLLPYFLSTYFVILLTEILILSIFAMSLNLLAGYLGYVSLGHAIFFGVGGYSLALISTKGGLQNFLFCLIVILIIGAIFSMVLGFLSMRVSGIYFLMITLAIGQMFWAVVWSWRSLTGGDDGIPGIRRPILGLSLSLSNEINFFHFILIFFIFCLFLLYRIANSPFGFTLLGIRSDEVRMRALGYNTWRYKYFCYVISGIFGSLAGFLKVYQDCFVNPSYANIAQSGLVLLMVLIGGSGSFFGPIIGAITVTIAAHIISSYTDYWLAFLGITLIFFVVAFPEGIAGYFTKIISKNVNLK